MAFLGNHQVWAKVNNYQLVRGKLHLRFVLNGSPFHYGLIKMTYVPFYRHNHTYNYNSVQKTIQLPGVMMDVSSDTVADYVCPFFTQRRWIDMSPVGFSDNLEDATGANLGYVRILPVAPLGHANTSPPPPVHYSVFAWLEDAELDVPTPYSSLIYQSDVVARKKRRPRREGADDEYSKSPVSSIATAVFNAAGALADVPVIGPFARATEIGAGAISSIARLFGFSRPTILDNTVHVRPELFGWLASGYSPDSTMKLSLDPKQEIVIGGGSLGLPDGDDMALSSILSRDGYLNLVSWNSTAGAGAQLYKVPVTPMVMDPMGSNPAFDYVVPTPQGWAGLAFGYWTGTLVYTVRVVATPYHRGRVRLVYFPRGNAILPNVDYSNTSYNVVLDISSDQEVDFEVPWTQSMSWLPTKTTFHGDPAADTFCGSNGTFALYVVNPLTGPGAVSSIQLLVTLKGGKDLRFSKPYGNAIQNFVSVPQLSTLNHPAAPNILARAPPTLGIVDYDGTEPFPVFQGAFDTPQESVDPLTFGETITSIRPLVKRYCPLVHTQVMSLHQEHIQPELVLPAPTYDLLKRGNDVKNQGGDTHGTFRASYQTFYTWFREGYAGIRGGSRFKIIRVNSGARYFGEAEPNAEMIGGDYETLHASLSDSVGYYTTATHNNISCEGANGAAIAATAIQGGIEAEVPYYQPNHFVVGPSVYNSAGLPADLAVSENSLKVQVRAPYNVSPPDPDIVTRLFVYSAGAEDTDFRWFVCVPGYARIKAGYGRSTVS